MLQCFAATRQSINAIVAFRLNELSWEFELTAIPPGRNPTLCDDDKRGVTGVNITRRTSAVIDLSGLGRDHLSGG